MLNGASERAATMREVRDRQRRDFIAGGLPSAALRRDRLRRGWMRSSGLRHRIPGCCSCFREIERDVFDHVFLPANGLHAAQLDENVL